MPAAQITSLLSNRDLDRLARLRLNSSRRFTNRARGEHLASKGGTSTEFCDYRDYSPGDDVRFVDWNIFARIERPYLKQFHHEEELHLAVVLDASNSMLFEEKFIVAQRLAAAFGAVGLRGNEKVSVTIVGEGAPRRLQPSSGRATMQKLFTFLEGHQPGGEMPFDVAIEAFLRRHSGRGAAILISDFLSGSDFLRPFNLLNGSGLEIFGLQVLGPGELAPELAGDLRFVDSETHGTLDITSAGDLMALYHEYREGHATRLAELCRQRNGRFVTVNAADPFEDVMFGVLRRKGWLV